MLDAGHGCDGSHFEMARLCIATTQNVPSGHCRNEDSSIYYKKVVHQKSLRSIHREATRISGKTRQHLSAAAGLALCTGDGLDATVLNRKTVAENLVGILQSSVIRALQTIGVAAESWQEDPGQGLGCQERWVNMTPIRCFINR